MPAKKASTTVPKKSKAVAKKRSEVLPVSGDNRVQTIQFSKSLKDKFPAEKKTKAAKNPTPDKSAKKSGRLKDAPTVAKVPTLVSVSLDEKGTASVARYAGLFFVLTGVCFAAHALSTLYVETEILSNSSTPLMRTSGVKAEMISAVPREALAVDDVATAPASDLSEIETVVGEVAGASSTDEVVEESRAELSEEEGISALPVSTPPSDEYLTPSATISILASESHPSEVVVSVEVEHAHMVQIFAVPVRAMVPRYIGTAGLITDGSWRETVDTLSMPEGEYRLYARIHNKYGIYESSAISLSVDNVASISPREEEETSETLESEAGDDRPENEEVPTEVEVALMTFDNATPAISITGEVLKVTQGAAIETSEVDVDSASSTSTTTPEASVGVMDKRAMGFLLETEEELNALLSVLASALRGNDASGAERVRARIDEFERQRLDRIATDLFDPEDGENIARVRDRLAVIITDETARVEKREAMLIGRFGETLTKDSDRDSISDYDEVNTYGTNPSHADTDADGFTDGAEILAGYNPLDSRAEVVVSSKSPLEEGAERPDILAVSGLKVVASESPDALGGVLLTGTALPFSFVTLSIFSEPTVASVRTREDGSWSYLYDGELDDGEHSVYASMADNTGAIIAKSHPFNFEKNGGQITVGGTTSSHDMPVSDTRLFSESIFILVNSLGVIMLGLVLMILGVHFGRARKAEAPAAAVPST